MASNESVSSLGRLTSDPVFSQERRQLLLQLLAEAIEASNREESRLFKLSTSTDVDLHYDLGHSSESLRNIYEAEIRANFVLRLYLTKAQAQLLGSDGAVLQQVMSEVLAQRRIEAAALEDALDQAADAADTQELEAAMEAVASAAAGLRAQSTAVHSHLRAVTKRNEYSR